MGISLSKLGHDDEAIEQYINALKIKPNDYESIRNMGISLSNLGRDDEAIEQYTNALKIKPNDYESIRNMGISLSTLGRDDEAIEQYTNALKIKPDDYNSLKYMGISLSNLGRDDEAIKQYTNALNVKPDDYESIRNIIISLSALGRDDQAIEQYGDWFKSEDWKNLISKAFALKNIGKTADAAKIYACISKNKNKVKDKETIFIASLFNQKDVFDEKDILVEIIRDINNRTKQQEQNSTSDIYEYNTFFKTMEDIEKKFQKFVDCNRSIPTNFFSFLSILRRWNSYTPILPSEKNDNKGGGYFLFHAGKGIVIDPGFNFIENFYKEGFKIADIDAVLITHAHNDHTVDLESILTLIYKLNESINKKIELNVRDFLKNYNMEEEIDYKEALVREFLKNYITREEISNNGAYIRDFPKNYNTEEKISNEIKKKIKNKYKRIDLYLNLGTFKKYSGMLDLKSLDQINEVTVLMPNTTYDLMKKYDIKIHTTKAKHHEIIDEKYAIGFIIEINEKTKIGFYDADENIKIGFTGDTGWDENMVQPFKDLNPQLVVAHIGSIKRREFKYLECVTDDEKNNCFYSNHLGLLGLTRFLSETKPQLSIISEFGEELRAKRKTIAESISNVLKLNCLPGDIGLHIRLCDCGVHCLIEKDFVNYKSINVSSHNLDNECTLDEGCTSDEGCTLYFYSSKYDFKKFYDAVSENLEMEPTPLSDRTNSFKHREAFKRLS